MKAIGTLFLFLLLFQFAACNPGSKGDDLSHLNLPPDPGEEGKATLLGVDSDLDGVRDDAQIGIGERYPHDEPARLALTQLSNSIQLAFAAYEAGNAQAVSDAAGLITKGVDCLFARTEKPSQEVLFVENLMVNTDQRSEAYIDINQSFSDQFFGGDNDFEAACAQ